VIVTATVNRVGKMSLNDCPEEEATRSEWRADEYRRCGKVWKLTVSVKGSEKGDLPSEVTVFAAQPFLSLSCDDRPAVKKLKGLEVLLFLEKEGERLWTLDGPNSVYAWPGQIEAGDETIARVRRMIAAAG
jgi:hypothetical protein